MLNKTKIVCTIGSQSEPEAVMEKMLLHGMNAVRLNFAHGNLATQSKYVVTAKKLALIHGKPLSIMIDTRGPKVRTHTFTGGTALIAKGCKVVIKSGTIVGDSGNFSVTYENLYDDVNVDDEILVDDGNLSLTVKEKIAAERSIVCISNNSHLIKDDCSVNIPNVLTNVPYLSASDRARLDLAINQELDYIDASFVRTAKDVEEVKEYIASKNGNIKVVAKIENLQAIKHLDEIIEAADGIIVARGDLSIEVPFEEIPVLQKRIVKKCNDAGKFVLVATQMLSSMTRNQKPSRAEVSDVANAVLDGVDAIVLANETAVGIYPVEAVETLARITSRIENEIYYKGKIQKAYNSSEKTLNDAVALSVADTALLVDAKLIVAFSESGTTARRISKFRPICPIAAVTSSEKIRLSLTLNWGVHPVVSNQPTSELDYVAKACEIATYYGVKEGENIIITGGNGIGNTNFMKVIKL